jgi:hypothetical protein
MGMKPQEMEIVGLAKNAKYDEVDRPFPQTRPSPHPPNNANGYRSVDHLHKI